MKNLVSFSLIFALFMFSFVSASNYSIQFNQIENKLVVKESLNGINESSVSSVALEKISGGYYFVKRIYFSENFSYAEIILNLDKGFLADTNEAYPSNYKIESDGQNMRLIWKFNNVDSNLPIALFVKISDNGSSFNWLWIFAGILVLIFAVYILGRFYLKRNANFEGHLMESEKKVIEELKKAKDNELWQKQLLQNTGFSKAKLSRIIRDLGARDLIKKIPYGNTNKISLT